MPELHLSRHGVNRPGYDEPWPARGGYGAPARLGMEPMHVQLDPVGGIAGDMFAAAVLDAWPEFKPALAAAFERAGLDAIATVERIDHADHALTG